MSRETLDLRGLTPPEPMVRILSALAALGKDDELEAILPHPPVPLYGLLRERGAVWETLADEPGRFVLLVKKGA
jgi:TusA-related sulfurtransferase